MLRSTGQTKYKSIKSTHDIPLTTTTTSTSQTVPLSPSLPPSLSLNLSLSLSLSFSLSLFLSQSQSLSLSLSPSLSPHDNLLSSPCNLSPLHMPIFEPFYCEVETGYSKTFISPMQR